SFKRKKIIPAYPDLLKLHNMMPLKIVIDGNIGAGTTEQVKAVVEKMHQFGLAITTFIEQPKNWEPILNDFYQNREYGINKIIEEAADVY
ncbi:2167_t:CDS:1, partial [Ambispora gerdemannii]